MWLTIEISLPEEDIKKTLDDFSDKIQESVISKTPEKEGLLVDNIEKWKIKEIPDWYSQEVFTDIDIVKYGKIVEDWVKNRLYQYHKPTWVPFWKKQTWAKMYEWTYKNYQKILWSIQI